jgi:hypothetical protein
VTEPPEPRDPEEGGGEDDFLGELDDDMLLDALGRGEDEAGELGSMLGNWRDDVESEPVGPIAENAQEIHELNQQYDRPAEPPAPRAPETGGQPSMINEGAQILANAASNADTVRGMVNTAEEGVRNAAAALQEAIGILTQISGEVQTAAGGAEGDQLGGMGQQAVSELDQLLSAVALFDPDAAMQHIGQFFNAVSQAAQKHGS